MNNVMIPLSEPNLTELELEYLTDCFKSSWISGKKGVYITKFETEFAKYCESKYSTSVASGSSALKLAIKSIGINDGDEVIIPSNSYVATASAVSLCNGVPVFADCDEHTLCIDPKSIEKLLSKKTKAIIPVHNYGHPADMDPILEIARKNNIFVIENACESHGATYKGRKTGSMGDIGCFSLFASKVITTGEGGMVVSNNKTLYEKVKLLKDQATETQTGRWWHSSVGDGLRLSNLLASIGVAQLERIGELLKIKRQNAEFYKNAFLDSPDIAFFEEEKWANSTYHMYCIKIAESFPLTRDQLIIELGKIGIETAPFFTPLHKLPPYKHFSSDCTITEKITSTGICLPSSTKLNESDITFIANSIKKFSKK